MANDSKIQFAFQKKNYQFLVIGLVILAVGYMLMIGGGSADPNVFSEEIFSFRRITLSPIVILIGYVVIGYAIMVKPKNKEQNLSHSSASPAKK
jgi:uncharacterized integral membrane protein